MTYFDNQPELADHFYRDFIGLARTGFDLLSRHGPPFNPIVEQSQCLDCVLASNVQRLLIRDSRKVFSCTVDLLRSSWIMTVCLRTTLSRSHMTCSIQWKEIKKKCKNVSLIWYTIVINLAIILITYFNIHSIHPIELYIAIVGSRLCR